MSKQTSAFLFSIIIEWQVQIITQVLLWTNCSHLFDFNPQIYRKTGMKQWTNGTSSGQMEQTDKWTNGTNFTLLCSWIRRISALMYVIFQTQTSLGYQCLYFSTLKALWHRKSSLTQGIQLDYNQKDKQPKGSVYFYSKRNSTEALLIKTYQVLILCSSWNLEFQNVPAVTITHTHTHTRWWRQHRLWVVWKAMLMSYWKCFVWGHHHEDQRLL